MIEQIERIREKGRSEIGATQDPGHLEKLRVQYLGKKGILTSLLHQLKDLDPNARKQVGAVLNDVKTFFEREIEQRVSHLERQKLERELSKSHPIDVTLPGFHAFEKGTLHPVSRVIEQMTSTLRKVGFSIATGYEVETEYYNFEALNTPEDHPARDVQDTFYLNPPVLLRSHTSPIQIRTMQRHRPPLQILGIGKVYRSDYDQTHTPMFHQMEGLLVDRDISLSDLKGVLHYLVRQLFGDRPLRFRTSFFPFVEPGAEVDMGCIGCSGDNLHCKICKGSGWLEIGGCGMVHPRVFQGVGIDPDRYSGFAFGMGIERIAMLLYGVEDLRSFFENDIRFLEQF